MPDVFPPKGTEPAEDKDFAEKGATKLAPIPAEDRPDKDRDLKRAQAELDGKNPDFVEFVEGIEDGKKLVKVVKGAESLRVHPANVEAHLSLGYQVAADDEHADDLREVDSSKVQAKEDAAKAKADKKPAK